MMNRSKRIGFVVHSHSVHLSRVIFCRYGLGEVLIFTSVFSFLVSVVAGGLLRWFDFPSSRRAVLRS
jgi:hypothetical protein